MTIDDALKIATLRDVDLWRRCRKEPDPASVDGWRYIDDPDSLRAQALDVLATEVEAQRGRTCERCQHCRITQYRGDDPWCVCTQMSDGVHATVTYVPCRFLGNTCGAFAAREVPR